jgi:hypothetical protein
MLASTAIRRQTDGLILVDFDVQGNDLCCIAMASADSYFDARHAAVSSGAATFHGNNPSKQLTG